MVIENKAPYFAQFLAVAMMVLFLAGAIHILPTMKFDNLASSRDGALLGLFGMCSLSFLAYAIRKPAYRLEFLPSGQLLLQRSFLFFKNSERVSRKELGSLRIVESEDQDGDAYFKLVADFRDRPGIVLAQGFDLEHVQSEEIRVRSALKVDYD